MSRGYQPTRPAFQHHRRRASSTESYYTCGTSSYRLGSNRSPPPAFQPPSSSSHPPRGSLNERNSLSQSSHDHSSSYHSTVSRYPEPYTSNPFLPLKELRHLRSNEQLAKSTSSRPPTRARATRKPPPTLTLNGLDSNFNIPFPTVADNQFENTQGGDPEVELYTAIRPIAELFAGSPMSQVSRTDMNASRSDLGSAGFSYMSPPVGLYPVTPALDSPRGQPQSNIIAGSKRTMSIAQSRATDLSDVSPALEFMFGVGVSVNEVESCRVNISMSPADIEANKSIWGSQERNVAYGGIGAPDSVGKTELASTKNQIRSDPVTAPTAELAQIPWPTVSASSTTIQRKRPAPIYVGSQVQRPTVSQADINPAAGSNREVSTLKTESATSLNSDARSRKESEASQFSLSMFPATPTTPIPADIWAGLSSAQSPFRQTFSPNLQALGGRPAGLAPPLSAQSLHFPRSAPTTPVRREAIEIEPPKSTSYIRKRTQCVVTVSPAHQRERIRAVSIASQQSNVSAPEPAQFSLKVTVAEPVQEIGHEASPERHPTCGSSFCPHPVRSQDLIQPQRQDSGSDSCSSEDESEDDDAASMTSSVEEAIMMAQQERRWSRQSRLACMRDSFMAGSGREPSIESHVSSASSSGSANRSGIPLTPEDEQRYLDEEKPSVPNVKYDQHDALVPTVNIVPPTRRPVPRLSTIIEPTPYGPPAPAPRVKPAPLKPVSSMHSLRSRARSAGTTTISRSADFLPHGASRTTLTTDGGVGVHSLAHSKSMSALRPPSSGGQIVLEKKKKKPKPPFDKYGMPTTEQLKLASDMYIFDEFGDSVRFGDIFEGQKTAVCFIRHFWCPLCQDYMSSIVHLTEPLLVEKAGVKLVIIGNGSSSMIRGYREDIFNCSYEMYTDPSRRLYKALGMHLRTNDGGSEEEKGSYIKHGPFTGMLMVLRNALKMPLANAGDTKQLGGEFVLGPGLSCSFASRMHNTRSHTPIRDVLEAAGVDTKPWATDLSFVKSEEDQARWMDVQNEDLDRLIRRGLQQATSSCNLRLCELDDDVTGSGELDLGEFCRLVERLKSEVQSQAPSRAPPSPTPPAPSTPQPEIELDPNSVRATPRTTESSYEIEVKGRKRVELDHLEAALQSRNGSSTWEACRPRKQGSSRPGTANSRPGTAKSTSSLS